MLGLKEKFINQKTKNLISKSKVDRGGMNFENAEFVAIFYTQTSENKDGEIQKFCDQLQREGKTVELITYIPKRKEEHAVKIASFYGDEFSFTGEVKSDALRDFLKKKYDLLIHCDLEKDAVTKFVMAKSKAVMRVGRYFEEEAKLYELMFVLQDDEKPRQMCALFHQYLKAIH
ncbi:hypothetical protein [Persicobacter sp. CCB-QB2]|uniref:DUF6913 domain-containing protein n=1 Tax=Persicobacter sp. CCB-QB2 TaxID=1561025 RepID=UPI0006A9641D|nr:hypothetical protein [Persicobacter sp. CCB-QB2]